MKIEIYIYYRQDLSLLLPPIRIPNEEEQRLSNKCFNWFLDWFHEQGAANVLGINLAIQPDEDDMEKHLCFAHFIFDLQDFKDMTTWDDFWEKSNFSHSWQYMSEDDKLFFAYMFRVISDLDEKVEERE